MIPSTIEEFNNLAFSNDLSLNAFGNASLSTVQKVCKEFGLTGIKQAKAEDVWTRHPNRKKQQPGIMIAFSVCFFAIF
jgi:hypothetical protein